MSDLDSVAAAVVSAVSQSFQYHKHLAERAIAQLPDEKLHEPLDRNTNSIAVIMKHVAGNLVSRWIDFLATDGEKPWRNRDDEFVDSFANREELLSFWKRGWQALFDALAPSDLLRSVTIRNEPHTVPLALSRSLAHTAYHVGQIVQTARFFAGDQWETLTIARGQSAQFNRRMESHYKSKA